MGLTLTLTLTLTLVLTLTLTLTLTSTLTRYPPEHSCPPSPARTPPRPMRPSRAWGRVSVCNSLAEKGVLLPPGKLPLWSKFDAQRIELESNWDFVSMMPVV